ncbi:hypothetical protein Hs30E_11880 [Lactococcus hodotermopsidis]|uniref:S1 motif domain-containing protein n=1 Tax=Pseudolactococcus hodotermopsidis TaxID=2709157 RepID=A0A6A0BFN0_9LACT|nr:hypothetical protein [Lactococcus hodotermopsidis]GFH42637.1 hypothetical protein Hs30E_11880 [Lactococcus hodotermopsidis]
MIGYVKNITRFGIFIVLNDNENGEMTGLLRWSSIPRGEKFHKGETLDVIVIEKHTDGKIDLRLLATDFREKYDKLLFRTSETLESLRERNQEIRSL